MSQSPIRLRCVMMVMTCEPREFGSWQELMWDFHWECLICGWKHSDVNYFLQAEGMKYLDDLQTLRRNTWFWEFLEDGEKEHRRHCRKNSNGSPANPV